MSEKWDTVLRAELSRILALPMLWKVQWCKLLRSRKTDLGPNTFLLIWHWMTMSRSRERDNLNWDKTQARRRDCQPNKQVRRWKKKCHLLKDAPGERIFWQMEQEQGEAWSRCRELFCLTGSLWNVYVLNKSLCLH